MREYFISDLCEMFGITRSLCSWYLKKQPYDIAIHPVSKKPAMVLNPKTAAVLYTNLLADKKIDICMHFYHEICNDFDYAVNSIAELVRKLGLTKYELWNDEKHRICNCLNDSDYIKINQFFYGQGLSTDRLIEEDYTKKDHEYKFNEWPDTVPDCFKDMDDDEELLK